MIKLATGILLASTIAAGAQYYGPLQQQADQYQRMQDQAQERMQRQQDQMQRQQEEMQRRMNNW